MASIELIGPVTRIGGDKVTVSLRPLVTVEAEHVRLVESHMAPLRQKRPHVDKVQLRCGPQVRSFKLAEAIFAYLLPFYVGALVALLVAAGRLPLPAVRWSLKRSGIAFETQDWCARIMTFNSALYRNKCLSWRLGFDAATASNPKETHMKRKILTATAISLCLATAAFAQSSGTSSGTNGTSGSSAGSSMSSTSGSGQSGIPSGWDSKLSGSFFRDANSGRLLSQDEIRKNWSSLSSEQQAQVRSDCSRMTASNGTGSGTMTGTSGSSASTGSDTTASIGTGSGTATGTSGSSGSTGSNTTASNSTGSGTTTGTSGSSNTAGDTTASTSTGSGANSAAQMASMQQLCTQVQGM
ncbi:hypothetical protein NKI46_25750 [Mesorhizobium sp. M0615]|uniref:hypothetical protein n=2 Tax=Mesorhizobium TaxID=68287 RepID=UPI003337F327